MPVVCLCSACVAVKDMDRHTCSFMSGPGRAPLGSDVKIGGKKGEEKRGGQYQDLTLHLLYPIYLFI